MTQTHANAARRGFTLIELLVVIAIIAVLISILLPSMRSARSQAKKILCMTNLRAQGEVVTMYAHDNNDFIIRGIENPLPGHREWATYYTSLLKLLHYDGALVDGRGIGIWTNQRWLNEVVAKIPQYQCPSQPNDAVIDYVTSAIPIPYTAANRDIDANGGGQRGEGMQGEFPPDLGYFGLYRIGLVDRYGPGKLVLTTEAHESLFRLNSNTVRFNHFFYGSQLPFGAFPRIANDARHEGFINALFFDAHATSLRMNQFDIGWPNDLDLRMRWITTPIEGE